MTTRQEATTNAIQWAQEAETRFSTAEYAEHYDQAEDARRMADTWTRIARLLPTVLPDDQLEAAQPCGHERPTLAGLIPPAHCTLPTGHRPPHRDPTGTSWNIPQQCPSHHAFDDYEEHCERQAGHHGIHTARGVQWGPNDPAATTGHLGSREAQANAAPSTSIPSQRPAADDQPPRCPSRYGGEQCERAAGHSGIHQGTSCGWRNATPGPEAPGAERCCERALVLAADLLLRHARMSPGLTLAERRALEDAAGFIRAHEAVITGTENEVPCDRVVAGDAHPVHLWTTRGGGTARCPGTGNRP